MKMESARAYLKVCSVRNMGATLACSVTSITRKPASRLEIMETFEMRQLGSVKIIMIAKVANVRTT